MLGTPPWWLTDVGAPWNQAGDARADGSPPNACLGGRAVDRGRGVVHGAADGARQPLSRDDDADADDGQDERVFRRRGAGLVAQESNKFGHVKAPLPTTGGTVGVRPRCPEILLGGGAVDRSRGVVHRAADGARETSGGDDDADADDGQDERVFRRRGAGLVAQELHKLSHGDNPLISAAESGGPQYPECARRSEFIRIAT